MPKIVFPPHNLYCMKTRINDSFSLIAGLLAACISTETQAEWARFRGPNGAGVAPAESAPPVTWSDSENLHWRLDMPGPGSSCPVVHGDRVFITYWSGYAVDPENTGDMKDLKLHLMAVDRSSGKTVWDKTIQATLPEQDFGGMFAQHGYASHTPTTDGKHIYAYFGKSGVYAFDWDGNQVWKAHVGDGLDSRGWGSASSPVLTNEAVIITGAIEDQTIVAYRQSDGKVLWQRKEDNLTAMWCTPVVLDRSGKQEIAINVPKEIWGLDATTGKTLWKSSGVNSDSPTGSLTVQDDVFFAASSRGAGSVAVKLGDSQPLWKGRDGANIQTPVVYLDRIYWIANGSVHCQDTKTGEEIYSERLPAEEAPASSGGRGRGGRFASMDYASPVIANGHLYQVKRSGETIVLKLGDRFEVVARNRFESDRSNFSATPAISDNEMFIRSYKALYCIAKD